MLTECISNTSIDILPLMKITYLLILIYSPALDLTAIKKSESGSVHFRLIYDVKFVNAWLVLIFSANPCSSSWTSWRWRREAWINQLWKNKGFGKLEEAGANNRLYFVIKTKARITHIILSCLCLNLVWKGSQIADYLTEINWCGKQQDFCQ